MHLCKSMVCRHGRVGLIAVEGNGWDGQHRCLFEDVQVAIIAGLRLSFNNCTERIVQEVLIATKVSGKGQWLATAFLARFELAWLHA